MVVYRYQVACRAESPLAQQSSRYPVLGFAYHHFIGMSHRSTARSKKAGEHWTASNVVLDSWWVLCDHRYDLAQAAVCCRGNFHPHDRSGFIWNYAIIQTPHKGLYLSPSRSQTAGALVFSRNPKTASSLSWHRIHLRE